MASLMKHKKKTKPKIIELNEPLVDLTNEDHSVVDNVVDRSDQRPESLISDSTSIDVNSPSAPPEHMWEPQQPTDLANSKEVRTDFMVKVFSVLFVQKLSFTTLITVFTFVPHLRKVVRKWIFDPLFVSSMIGYPLIIVPVLSMLIWPGLRRRLAKLSFAVLTICLSLLMSYAISPKTATAFIYSMGASNVCDFGVILGSKMKRDFTKWRYICLIPTFMIASGIAGPYILKKSLNQTIWPSIATSIGSTYLAANTVPVIRYNDLGIEPNEYVFAATQLYLNPERAVKHAVKKFFFGSKQPNQRGYQPIR